MATFQTLPGFREFYPEDYAERRHVFQVWRQTARRFGFQEYDGPVLESLELFKAKSGPEIEEQLFCFEDKGGRSVSLRPELTPTLARMVAAKANALRRPVKWFSVGDNFRYERMQKGRLRCFTQFNADILGEENVSADIELISLLTQTLQSFGLGESDFYIRLSDRSLWMLFLEASGYGSETALKILGVVDKWDRLTEDKIESQLSALAGEGAGNLRESISRFLEISSLESLKEFLDANGWLEREGVAERLNDWERLLAGLGAMGMAGFARMDLSIVRGLAYYTGFVFEAFDRKNEFRALAGGGRYDGLVKKMGGPDMPAVGFGMGDVVLSELLKARGHMPRFFDTVDLYAVIGGDAERNVALADVARLRQAGFIVDYAFRNQGFGKQFKAASASGARFALIYGTEEIEKGVVTLRNLESRAETNVPRDGLLRQIAAEFEA